MHRIKLLGLQTCAALLCVSAAASAGDSDHWSFRPPGDPPGSIDSFIGESLHDNRLTWSPPADRRTLIRRLDLVMLGLPPSPAEVDRFVAETEPDAWERLVDRRLASPHYGERWGQHWLDLVRFGETQGFETNRERPNAWPYRDWVIDSLNADVPYDRFVVAQLAGDSVGEPIATGFLVAGPNDIVKSPDVTLTLTQRQDELADILNTTGTAFLGLTLGCARCHDHKFDPVSQKDYYATQAVFAGVQHGERAMPMPVSDGLRDPVSATHNVERFPPTEAKFVRFTILETNSVEPCIDEWEVFAIGENVAPRATASASGTYPNSTIHRLAHINDGQYGNPRSWISDQPGGGWVQLEFPESVTIDRIEWARDRDGQYGDRLATRYRIEAATEPGAWETIASSEDRLPIGSGRMVYAGTFAEPGPTHLLYRGDPMAKRDVVPPDAVASLGSLEIDGGTPESLRRLAFAGWVAGDDNPLTARVIANRVWQFHFGTGIVPTPSDFGRNGVPPTHPELLDRLARDLLEDGWSLKRLHRAILTSRTWQQDSRPTADGVRIDADTRLLWRFPPRRLEAEAIRDSILGVTGVLDRRMGGPGFSGFEVQQENVRHYFPKKEYGPEDWRRMVYMTKVRQERESVFGVFDCPDASQVVPDRGRSTTPLQALNLFNSRFVSGQAERFATRLHSGADTDAGRVRLAYRLCYGREPTAGEVSDAVSFIADRGLPLFCRAVLNSNEFLFIP